MKDAKRHYLFMTLGAPGSGKSYVADWLTPQFRALRLRSDDMRVAMFGPLRPELHHEPYSSIISGAMGYAAKQALLQKHNVIYDTNSNSVEHRKKMADIAIHTGALSVVVWVETPLQVAKERALVRDQIENDSEEVDISYIEIMAAKIEPPTANELVIKIDGTVSADQQKEIFIQQLEEIEGNI